VDLDAGVLSARHSLEEVASKLTLKVPKTKSGLRSMVAVQALRERWAMAEGVAGVPFVFCDTEEKPPRKSNFERRVWKPLRRAARLPDAVRFHDLRHTSASRLLKAGEKLKAVQERFGHADVRITLNTYSHVTSGMQEKAAAVFDDVLTKPSQKSANGYKLATLGENSGPETGDASTEVEAS
jgi:integrase